MTDNIMKHKQQKNSLGKGLAALLGDVDYIGDDEKKSPSEIPTNTVDIQLLIPGKMQPRQRFEPERLKRLAESIKDRGILQPILVRTTNDNRFEIIAGERRWRAAKDAGLKTVPIYVYDCTDRDALELGLIENLQRDDLNPVEEGESLKRLMEEFNKTQDEVALAIRKSRSYVANLIRLGNLPEKIKELLRERKLSAGHARALLTVDESQLNRVVQEILESRLSVRETEELCRQKNKKGTKVQKMIDPDLLIVAESLQEKTGLPTKIDITKRGGYIKMYFETYEQLDQVVTLMQEKL